MQYCHYSMDWIVYNDLLVHASRYHTRQPNDNGGFYLDNEVKMSDTMMMATMNIELANCQSVLVTIIQIRISIIGYYLL